MELLFDGKPVTRAFNFRVYVAPIGETVVVAVTGGTNSIHSRFWWSRQESGSSDTVERGSIDNVVFSPMANTMLQFAEI